jgi:xylulokinase
LAYIGGGGIALRWFRDQFYNTSKGKALPPEEDLYAEMIAVAEGAPLGSDGLLFSPHLGGRICPSSPGMRGAWAGFSWSHTQAHFARSILESIAYEYAYYLKILRELMPKLELVEHGWSGGAGSGTRSRQVPVSSPAVHYSEFKPGPIST